MKKVRARIIFSVLICLWSFNCLAVKDVNKQLDDAVFWSKIDEVKQAIMEGADVNLRYGVSCRTPLDTAIERAGYAITQDLSKRYKAFNVLRLLLEKNAHINSHGEFGWTPLMHALAFNEPNLIVVELLLNYGADPEVKSTKGKTALSRAQNYRFREALELLINYPALLQKVKTQPSRALLSECIEKGYFTLVRFLLQRGVIVMQADYELAKKKYNETQSMAYEIIGKLLKESLSTSTELGLIARKGIVSAHDVSHSGERLELTHDIAEHIGSFLPFTQGQQ